MIQKTKKYTFPGIPKLIYIIHFVYIKICIKFGNHGLGILERSTTPRSFKFLIAFANLSPWLS